MSKMLALVGVLAALVPIKCFANNFYLYPNESHENRTNPNVPLYQYTAGVVDDSGNFWECWITAQTQPESFNALITVADCGKPTRARGTNTGSGPLSFVPSPTTNQFQSSIAGFWRINTQTGDVHFCLLAPLFSCKDLKLP